jgi:lysozyme family protein
MSHATYAEALYRLLAHEGGYTNHPSDPGGPTNFGITIGDYRKYVKADATAADVRAMTVDEAKEIYLERYWNALRCDDLPAGVDYAIFDYAVNSGTTRAAKILYRVLGLSAASLKITDAVVDATAAHAPDDVINATCDERLAFLKSLKSWPTFGAGWGRRVAEVRAVALNMAKGTGAGPKATTGRAKNITGKVVAGAAVGGGVVAAHQAWSHSFIVFLSIAVIAITATGIWWLWRAQKFKEKP